MACPCLLRLSLLSLGADQPGTDPFANHGVALVVAAAAVDSYVRVIQYKSTRAALQQDQTKGLRGLRSCG